MRSSNNGDKVFENFLFTEYAWCKYFPFKKPLAWKRKETHSKLIYTLQYCENCVIIFLIHLSSTNKIPVWYIYIYPMPCTIVVNHTISFTLHRGMSCSRHEYMAITDYSENYNGHACIGGYFIIESHLLFFNFIFKHIYLFYNNSFYWVPYYKV